MPMDPSTSLGLFVSIFHRLSYSFHTPDVYLDTHNVNLQLFDPHFVVVAVFYHIQTL